MGVRLTQEPVEVLGSGTPIVRVTQVPVEVLGSGTPIVRVTQVPVEVLGSGIPNVRNTQTYVEVIGYSYFPAPIFATIPFSPFVGDVLSPVKIYGSNFTGATNVTFNGTSATSFTVVSDTLITCVTPASFNSGYIAVVNPSTSTTTIIKFGRVSTGFGTY
jgi:hypothetical protein